MSIEPWQEIKRQQVFEKYSRAIERVDFRLPNGAVVDFYIKVEASAVATFGLTEDNKVILARQFRPGPQKILNELPGGGIDEGEDPLVAAKREFLEETGYQGDFEAGGVCIEDAYSTIERPWFVAKNCRKVAEPTNTPTEETEVVLLSIEEFREQLRSGQMTDVEIGYLALDYLNLL